ncbi:MAG: 30S ribosomal protein S7 [Candidatus Beckwithbacteria bacterium]|nr:30S ribosomal protein S7 [Patescibacteria group bacterium]
MPRTGRVNKRITKPDPVYDNKLVAKIINKIMYSGKKSIAQKHVYQALDLVKEQTKEDPIIALRQAIDNAKPTMEVRSRRVGGASYQVPMPVRGERRESLAIRWIIDAARKRPNSQYHHFYQKLAAELTDALKNQGGAVDKKTQAHKVAESNKAFSHFRW